VRPWPHLCRPTRPSPSAAAPTATADTADAPTSTAEAHSSSDATATPAPVASPESGGAFAIYPCGERFCSFAPGGSGDAQQVFAAAPPPADLTSYAFSPDGTQLLYALDKPGAEGSATLYLLAEGDAQPRALFDVAGSESGSGSIEGYGVLGFADGGASVVFEDQAQVFVAAPDGAGRRPVLEQRPYGASSTHTYYLAPDGGRVMVVGSGSPYYLEVADVGSGAVLTYTLGYDRTPIAFGDAPGQIVVEQSDPPVDQVEGNPATKSYWTLGFELLDLPAAPGAESPLPPGKLVYGDDGSASRGAASNVAAGKLLLRDYEFKEAGEVGALSLLDLRSGERVPVSLPGYATEEQRRVWLAAR
jgi:hypothetical protein